MKILQKDIKMNPNRRAEEEKTATKRKANLTMDKKKILGLALFYSI